MPADFLGLTGTIDLATVAILNPDNSIELINFSLTDSDYVRKPFFESLEKGGFDTGIAKKLTGSFTGSLKSAPLTYALTDDIFTMIETIQITDSVNTQVSKIVLLPAVR